MIKKIAFAGVYLLIVSSPLLVSAQTTSTTSNVSLIAPLTQLVQILEQELQSLLVEMNRTTHSPIAVTGSVSTQDPPFQPVAPDMAPPLMSINSNFSVVPFGYYTDGPSTFYVEAGIVHTLPDADPATFRVLTGSIFQINPYALDKDHVYYMAAIIPGADPQTFHVINGGEYGVDYHSAYWRGSVLSGVDLQTFSVSSSDWTEAEDKNHQYCAGIAESLGTPCTNI